MWHAYQAYQETTASYGNSLLNQEIEAHYVQFLYLSGLEEFNKPGNPWKQWYIADPRMKSIKYINQYIDDKGNLRSSDLNTDLEEHMKTVIQSFNKDESYGDYKNDPNRNALETFKNLRKLMNYK